MNQPYAAPGSDLETGSERRYQPRLFQVKGRLGRVRYFVYALTITLIVYIVFAAVTAAAAVAGGAVEPDSLKLEDRCRKELTVTRMTHARTLDSDL